MTDEQFERLLVALYDIKAEVRDLRNDLRKRADRDRHSVSRGRRNRVER